MHLDVLDFKKKKKAEERAKESQKMKEKNNEDYSWNDLCEDPTKLQKIPSAKAKQTLTPWIREASEEYQI